MTCAGCGHDVPLDHFPTERVPLSPGTSSTANLLVRQPCRACHAGPPRALGQCVRCDTRLLRRLDGSVACYVCGFEDYYAGRPFQPSLGGLLF